MCKISSFWGYTVFPKLLSQRQLMAINVSIWKYQWTQRRQIQKVVPATTLPSLFYPSCVQQEIKTQNWRFGKVTISGKTLTLRQRQGCGELEQQYSHSYKSPTYYLGHISTHKNVFKHNLWNDTLTHTSYHLYRVFFSTGTPPKNSKYKKVNLG